MNKWLLMGHGLKEGVDQRRRHMQMRQEALSTRWTAADEVEFDRQALDILSRACGVLDMEQTLGADTI